MRYLFSLGIVLLITLPVFSQQDIASTSIFYPELPSVISTPSSEIAWVAPTFPGGQTRMISFISAGISYPELAQDNNIEGSVVVRLSLTAEGEIFGVETLHSLGFGCDEIVLARVASLPAFNPGLQYGKKVESTVVIPVRFRLR